MQSLVKIRNQTNVEQYVVTRGRRFSVGPKEQKLVEQEVADALLEACHPAVVEVPRVNQASVSDFGAPQDTVWLANMTGSPDAPDEIDEQYPQKDQGGFRWAIRKVPNPLKTPRSLKFEFNRGMRSYISHLDGALEALNLGKAMLEIPEYSRVQFPKHIAQWIRGRDARAGKGYSGAVIKSRPPTNFEPTEEWDLDDIRHYLRLIDRSATLGPSEAQLKAQAQKEGRNEMEVLSNAKDDLLRRAFFYVANPKYRLPTRLEFEEFVTGQASEEPENPESLVEQAEKETVRAEDRARKKRKPGRPRKNEART